MRRAPIASLLLMAGVAACATPGQVRRVETAVAAADRDRARSDSAQRSELARIQIAQRQSIDTLNSLIRQLTDAIQRNSRDNAAGFAVLQQSLYQVQNLTSTGISATSRLANRIDNNLATSPVPSAGSDTTRRAGTPVIPQPGELIAQARNEILSSAYPAARRSMNQLLISYPQSPEVPEAYYVLGQTFEADQPDSARFYYTRTFTSYPSADRAPSALYKLGNLELKLGNLAAARRAWQTIVDKYKTSTESSSAQDRLRENP